MKAEKDSDLEMGMGWRQGQTETEYLPGYKKFLLNL